MINYAKLIRQAYYNALSGLSVPAYKEDVPEGVSDFVVIRFESATDLSHNQGFIHQSAVIVEIVKSYINAIDPDEVEDISQQISTVLKPVVTSTLSVQGLQVVYMNSGEPTYLTEDDGTKRYYRKIMRFTNRIVQQ